MCGRGLPDCESEISSLGAVGAAQSCVNNKRATFTGDRSRCPGTHGVQDYRFGAIIFTNVDIIAVQ